MYNGSVVTFGDRVSNAAPANDEAGGCRPLELGFSVENVRFMKPGGSHATICKGYVAAVDEQSVLGIVAAKIDF